MHLNSDSRFREFLAGFTSPFRVLGLLLEHPSLLILFLLPVASTLLILSIVLYALLAGAWGFFDHMFHLMLGHEFGVGSHILTIILGAILVTISFFSLNILIQTVSIPFNDLLAEKTERVLGEAIPGFAWMRFLKVLSLDFQKSLLSILLALLMTGLGFIPGAGILSLIGFVFIQAFTYLGYPQSRRAQGVLTSVWWIRINLFRAFGFGLASLILFWVPVLNLFALPISIVAGTMTYHKK